MSLIRNFSCKFQRFVDCKQRQTFTSGLETRQSILSAKLVTQGHDLPLFQILRDYLPGTALGIALVQGSTGARTGMAACRAETYDDGALVRLR